MKRIGFSTYIALHRFYLPILKGMRGSFVFLILGQFVFFIPLPLPPSLPPACSSSCCCLNVCLSVVGSVVRPADVSVSGASTPCWFCLALCCAIRFELSLCHCTCDCLCHCVCACVCVWVCLFVLWVNVRTRLCANCSSAAEVVHSVFILLVLCDI